MLWRRLSAILPRHTAHISERARFSAIQRRVGRELADHRRRENADEGAELQRIKEKIDRELALHLIREELTFIKDDPTGALRRKRTIGATVRLIASALLTAAALSYFALEAATILSGDDVSKKDAHSENRKP